MPFNEHEFPCIPAINPTPDIDAELDEKMQEYIAFLKFSNTHPDTWENLLQIRQLAGNFPSSILSEYSTPQTRYHYTKNPAVLFECITSKIQQ